MRGRWGVVAVATAATMIGTALPALAAVPAVPTRSGFKPERATRGCLVSSQRQGRAIFRRVPHLAAGPSGPTPRSDRIGPPQGAVHGHRRIRDAVAECARPFNHRRLYHYVYLFPPMEHDNHRDNPVPTNVGASVPSLY